MSASLAAAAALLSVSGCTSRQLATSGPAAAAQSTPANAAPDARVPSAATSAAAPFDLSSVMRQVHFAFRAEGDGFNGGHTTYSVAVDDGAIRVTPFYRSAHGGHGRPDASPRARALNGGSVRRAAAVEGAPLLVATATLRRGAVDLGRNAPPPRVDTDGSLLLPRGEAVERLRNREEGVEQSWEFARRPAGTGDLQVRVRVAGLPFAGETAGGLHFRDPASGLGLRYGRATWVGTDGRRVVLGAPRWSGREVALVVPEEVLEATRYPAVLDPVISPEFEMDTPVPVPAYEFQGFPAAAWDGTNWLVVWVETLGSYPGIAGTRVSAAGAILDIGGIKIAYDIRDEDVMAPAISWNGQSYLVVWSGHYGLSIEGARVGADGALLSRTPIKISYAGIAAASPSIAWNGANWLVTWADNSSTALIRAARVSPAGAVLGLTTVAAPRSLDVRATRTSVASDQSSWLVVWDVAPTVAETSDVWATRVSAAGTVLDTAGIAVSTVAQDQLLPEVAWTGTEYMVVWEDHRNGASAPEVVGARVSAAGVVLDSGWAISANAKAPSFACDGTQCFVAWADYPDDFPQRLGVRGVRLNSRGQILDPAATVFASNRITEPTAGAPAVAAGGPGFLVAWDRYTDGRTYNDVYGARVTRAGQNLDPNGFIVSAYANDQESPAVASDGANYLVVWSDQRGPHSSALVFGAAISESGALLNPSGISIGDGMGDYSRPAVAWDGTNFLVVWNSVSFRENSYRYQVRGQRVTPAGAVLDGSGFAVSPETEGGTGFPTLAWNGANYLVDWVQVGVDGEEAVYGARVSASGSVLDPAGILVAGGQPGKHFIPAVASNGSDWLVAWWSRLGSGGITSDVSYTMVSAIGAVRPPAELVVHGTASAIGAVAFGGTNFLVTWTDYRVPGASRLWGARISSAGALLDPSGIQLVGSESSDFPSVTWDGRFFVVFAHLQPADPAVARGLYALRVRETGAVLDPSGIMIDEDTGIAGYWLGAASGQVGKSLVVYEQFGQHADRIFGRLVKTVDPLGAACTLAVTCESGHCADSVCCDSDCAGQCEACDVAENLGACVPAKGPPRGAREACPGPGVGLCAGACDGATREACAMPGALVECVTASCSDGFETPAAVCDGAGACLEGEARSCGDYRCGETQCKTSCAAEADCASGLVCRDGACAEKTPCADDSECGPDLFCRDGDCVENPGCKADADCGAGRVCREGVCLARTASAPVAGCACGVGIGSGRGEAWWVAALLGAVWCGRPRRTRFQSRNREELAAPTPPPQGSARMLGEVDERSS